MTDPIIQKFREKFDKLFYRNENRVWMSRSGESYDSVVPEMGRGELFRFIEKEIQQAILSDRQLLKEKIEGMMPADHHNDDYFTGKEHAFSQVLNLIENKQ